jgi:hypothetical protein
VRFGVSDSLIKYIIKITPRKTVEVPPRALEMQAMGMALEGFGGLCLEVVGRMDIIVALLKLLLVDVLNGE